MATTYQVLLDSDVHRSLANGGGAVVGLAWTLATIVLVLAVLLRRLHLAGKSGWWALIDCVPIGGGIILPIFTVQDSTLGENQFGQSPKAGSK